jgi:hypothetical protein
MGPEPNANLTPREVDVTGLSFFTELPTVGKYNVTTMEQVNATGTLSAVQDGANHV